MGRRISMLICCALPLLAGACDDMLDAERPLYEKYDGRASLLGDAVPGALWSADSAALMETVRAGLYRWTGTLGRGELKAAWGKPDFTRGRWYMAVSPGSLVETNLRSAHTALYPAVYVAIGEAPNNWQIAQEGEYRVTLDTGAGTMEFTRMFSAVYLVGDAAPGGWDLSAAQSMPRLEDGTFLWRGSLAAGEVKFICKLISDDALSFGASPEFRAAVEGNPFSGAEQELVYHTPLGPVEDYKFRVDTAGDWTITVDPYRLKVKAVKNP